MKHILDGGHSKGSVVNDNSLCIMNDHIIRFIHLMNELKKHSCIFIITHIKSE